jgi:glycosyltransferase involved in cell wall biosynthesis
MKLACVVHRYGHDVAGGSEAHCRAIAERLAARHDVSVLTTTARDHVTWAEAWPAGVSGDGPLRVHRFPVARQRSLHRFFEASEIAFGGTATEADEVRWFRENGPETPALVEYLEAHGGEYDRILFWSYRYYQTFFGLPPVARRAVLVPTAEEDPAIRLDVLDRFFALPSGYVFLTPEEQAIVARRCSQPLAPSCIIGTGLEPPPAASGSLQAAGVEAPYVLYLGRVDPNKGCETLFRHVLRVYDGETEGTPRVPLVLAGPANMPIPDHQLIRSLGYVTDEVREALLAHATVLVVPSPYESLSMALLEAWNHGVPALVNGRCRVLKGQALRSGGALFYRDFDEFAHGLRFLLTHDAERRQLGRQGRAYIDREYRWPHVMDVLERFLASLPPVSASPRR